MGESPLITFLNFDGLARRSLGVSLSDGFSLIEWARVWGRKAIRQAALLSCHGKEGVCAHQFLLGFRTLSFFFSVCFF